MPFVRLLVPCCLVFELRPDVRSVPNEEQLALELVCQLPGRIDREGPRVSPSQLFESALRGARAHWRSEVGSAPRPRGLGPAPHTSARRRQPSRAPGFADGGARSRRGIPSRGRSTSRSRPGNQLLTATAVSVISTLLLIYGFLRSDATEPLSKRRSSARHGKRETVT
jgi:hypothetical protein